MLDSSSSRETVSQEDTLTDDDIQQLLLQAEARLRSSESSTSNTSSLAPLEDKNNAACGPYAFLIFAHWLLMSRWHEPQRIPKIPSSQGLQAYIHQKDDVATVDNTRVIDTSQKKLSDKPWSVESLTSRSKVKVSLIHFIQFNNQYVVVIKISIALCTRCSTFSPSWAVLLSWELHMLS